MAGFVTTGLAACIARHRGAIPELADVGEKLRSLSYSSDAASLAALYDQCYPLLERAMWSGRAGFHGLLADYQALFREQEALIRQTGRDRRHDFIISIPVADRPSHLHACLESLYRLCRLYDYGGREQGRWGKIQVVVAEDSREEANIRRHFELADEYRQKGLQIHHFGLDEQYERLHSLPAATRARLGRLLTRQPRERFYHKGQAANRNLSLLKCLDLTEDKSRTLYYLVDSDQHFCVNRQGATGEEAVYGLNYFYYLDRIFQTGDVEVLTGKLVGDPPVSPSVMAGNFLDDVLAFFRRLATAGGRTACRFHDRPENVTTEAAYHDLAALFGYEAGAKTFDYACRLEGAHDHAACLADFAGRLNSFFFGEHLTRKTWFRYGDGFMRLSPARTVYPGNTIVNYPGLKYVIPFGHLRLRMSGPTAGRLIAAEIGPRFASANLPNLHRRIGAAGLAGDFRPGVEADGEHIDVADEFERQFFGDLMLFSAEALVKTEDVGRAFDPAAIAAVVAQKEAELLALYRHKHEHVIARCRELEGLVFAGGHWWQHDGETEPALRQVRRFISDIGRNFGTDAAAWQKIRSAAHRARRRAEIIDALAGYRAEREAWDSLF